MSGDALTKGRYAKGSDTCLWLERVSLVDQCPVLPQRPKATRELSYLGTHRLTSNGLVVVHDEDSEACVDLLQSAKWQLIGRFSRRAQTHFTGLSCATHLTSQFISHFPVVADRYLRCPVHEHGQTDTFDQGAKMPHRAPRLNRPMSKEPVVSCLKLASARLELRSLGD